MMVSHTFAKPNPAPATPTFPGRRSVAAVVVTFNRKVLLAECLDALLGQTQALDQIFVVDQASTDGTENMLKTRGYLEQNLVTYSRSQKNTGGAGGFQRGVDLAYRSGFDLIWIMDDDAIADSSALRTMLHYIDYPRVAAIANAKIRLDGTLDEGHLVYADKKNQSNTSPARLTFSSFVGLLITRAAIDQIGAPMAELFLQGDDTEYCRRLCRVGSILFARDSIIVHKEVSRPPEKTRRFGREFTVYPADRFCFQYFLWRNRVWIETHGQGFQPARICWLIGKLVRVLIRTCLIDQTQLRLRLYVLARAMRDGLLGRFDNEFPFRIREKVLNERGSPS